MLLLIALHLVFLLSLHLQRGSIFPRSALSLPLSSPFANLFHTTPPFPLSLLARSPAPPRTTRSLRSLALTTGTTFTHWIADHNVLWRSPLTPAALEQSIRYYALIGQGSPALGWAYLGIGIASMLAALTKLISGWRGKSGEVLFDGASLRESKARRAAPSSSGVQR